MPEALVYQAPYAIFFIIGVRFQLSNWGRIPINAWLVAWLLLAGVCARRRTHFLLLRQKKVSKEKATPSLRPLRLRYGANLGRGACGVCRGTHCAPLALRSDNRGKSDNEAWALERPCSPRKHPAPGAATGG